MVVGRVGRPQGVRGELRVQVLSDSPQRFAVGGVLFIQGRPYRIERSFPHQEGRVVKLEGIESRNEAEKLRGQLLEVPEEAVPPLPQGQYYHYQILGMRVVTQEGEELGKVADILSTGSNDVYVVREEGGWGELLGPALEGV
ncbi:MAG: ribosome maturation factor RimM, partial [Dehalococcoidia bacterium]